MKLSQITSVLLVLAVFVVESASAFVHGTNLAGWLIPQPWITPQLFYRFLDKNEGETAMDAFSICELLGADEGSQFMNAHWNSWVTTETF